MLADINRYNQYFQIDFPPSLNPIFIGGGGGGSIYLKTEKNCGGLKVHHNFYLHET